MSSNDGDEEIPGREIAYRLLAAEYDDASLSYAESDEERAPNYVIAPTGARVNRLFVVGTLTEVTPVNDEMVRARVVDPTGAFVVYAGQYQPDELAFLEGIEPPAFVAVTGKARTFQPDDSDRVYTSIRPESIATVDADTRDRWVVSAAERTLDRVGTYAGAAELEARGDDLSAALEEAGVDSPLASGTALALDHYETTPSYLAALRTCAIEAVEVVAGDRDQVSGVDVAPDESVDGRATFSSLADLGDGELETVGDAVSGSDESHEPERSVAATATSDDVGGASEDIASTSTDAGSEAESSSASADAETTTDAESIAPDADLDGATDSDSGTDASSAESPAESTFDEAVESDGSDDDDGDLDDLAAGDVGAEMYEMGDDERERLEAEFGAEFTTGTEVDDPGESSIADSSSESDDDLGAPPSSRLEDSDPQADSETDDAGEPSGDGIDADGVADADSTGVDSDDADSGDGDDLEAVVDETAEGAVESEDEGEDEVAEDADEPDESEPTADVDVDEYVVETMQELDDGDGADRTALIEAVVDDLGVSEDEVEDAIQDALMGGQCYEPDDETLKAI
ncbi:hypothetical protein [Natrarchaeobius oligotrophus]|uniref:Rpa-associated protein n=1 Tax=Natrarchaeobius chitinivorans TaxID=1679083 RepID=A0A3N6M9G5_NATCH|nr:hypothetical protein [Natrarchaeobius chitinivorans]RQH00404.1 hypothetical protein EA472_11205 [Natrarchaeobius chitinivorans]